MTSSPYQTARPALEIGSEALMVSTKLASAPENDKFVNQNPSVKNIAERKSLLYPKLFAFPSEKETICLNGIGCGGIPFLIKIHIRKKKAPINSCCAVRNIGVIPKC